MVPFFCYPNRTSKFCKKRIQGESEDRNFKRVQSQKGFRPQGKSKINEIEEESDTESDQDLDADVNMAYLATLKSTDELDHLGKVASEGPQFIEVSINDIKILMEIDTGACKATIFRKYSDIEIL